MSPPRSLMEFDLHARVLRETYRDLLGIQDGVEADARFLAFCRGYVHVYDESYRTLHASLGSQQDPSPASPTISISSAATSKACTPTTAFRTPDASTSAAAHITPQPSTSSAAASSEFFYREFNDPTISPIVHRKLFPSFIDTQLFTPPSLIQTPRDATHSSHSDDTIILEDAPQSSQDMTDDTIVIQDASQDVSDSEEDITIEDTCTY